MNPHNKLFKFSEVSEIVKRFQLDMKKLHDENTKLKKEVSNLKKELSELKNKVKSLEDELGGLKEEYHDILDDNDLLNKNVEEMMQNAKDSEKELVRYMETMLKIPIDERSEEYFDNLE